MNRASQYEQRDCKTTHGDLDAGILLDLVDVGTVLANQVAEELWVALDVSESQATLLESPNRVERTRN